MIYANGTHHHGRFKLAERSPLPERIQIPCLPFLRDSAGVWSCLSGNLRVSTSSSVTCRWSEGFLLLPLLPVPVISGRKESAASIAPPRPRGCFYGLLPSFPRRLLCLTWSSRGLGEPFIHRASLVCLVSVFFT